MSRIIIFVILVSCTTIPKDSKPHDLDIVVESHLKAYDTAREFLKERIKVGKAVTRDEWESLLAKQAIPANQKLLAQIDQRHKLAIAQAKETARQSSLFSLAKVRQDDLVEKFCAEIPKGGALHLHPSGMIHKEPLRKLMVRVNPKVSRKIIEDLIKSGAGNLYPGELDFLNDLPPTPYIDLSPEQQERMVGLFFLPQGAHPFSRFEAVFNFTSLIHKADFDAKRVYYSYFTALAKEQGIFYQELSKGMKANPDGLAYYDELALWLEKEHGVRTNFLMSYGRWASAKRHFQKTAELIKQDIPPRVVGVNMVGYEAHEPLLEKGQGLYGQLLLHPDRPIHTSAHVGEHGDPRNLRDAMIMKIERLGHGVLLADQVLELEIARRLGVVIETSVLSNLKLGVIEDVAEHPFLKFLRLGLRVSLSTDDEGIFRTNINQECQAAILYTDIEYSELKEVFENSLHTAFLEEQEKSELIEKLKERFKDFEKSWLMKLKSL
ncbi:hypothetical protein [Pseudobacteriovorax antillogorgiicola]|uniref:Adenosine deaminase n=1 Tax=Pseudobacteriovorax antillogorgiicola TaxID=1513793 RepID=A0A1Y6CXL6_9BACT|nr:hypothetical protein [Pseudobacteriovorax antillogorgiicola]TCS42853.1 adenosine deaminase [Pseudobacteriovorax antillogorgiicola]SMF81866.1 adenosine deaminase [Pseudobacteriovorax antillogorgiicola]